MKKLYFLLFIFLLSISSITYAKAFTPPDSERWAQVADTSWMDLKSAIFEKEKNEYSNHHNHRMAKAWILFYHPESNQSLLMYQKYDVDCRTATILKATATNHNNGQKFDMDCSNKKPEPIAPHTADEFILEICHIRWQIIEGTYVPKN